MNRNSASFQTPVMEKNRTPNKSGKALRNSPAIVNYTFKPIIKIIDISLVLFFLATLMNCSLSRHKIPENYVDHPAILPKGMNKNSLKMNRDMLQSGNIKRELSRSFVHSIIPSRGLGTNWEMPLFPFPQFTYLFNENDYYKLNRIGYNHFYHLVSFGLTDLGYTTREEFKYGLLAAYKNIIVFNGKIRNESVVNLNYDAEKGTTWVRLSLEHTAYLKVWDNTSVSAGIEFFAGSKEKDYNNFGSTQYIELNEFLSFGFQQFISRNFSICGYFHTGIIHHKNNPSQSPSTSFTKNLEYDWDLKFNVYW